MKVTSKNSENFLYNKRLLDLNLKENERMILKSSNVKIFNRIQSPESFNKSDVCTIYNIDERMRTLGNKNLNIES